LSDPGPKNIKDWGFSYDDINHEWLVNKINEFKHRYPALRIDYKLMYSNEISDYDLITQIGDRSLLTGYLNNRDLLIRSLHVFYNFERCGNYILEKEASLQTNFDFIIFVRPDLFFTNRCHTIEMYNNSLVTLANGPNDYNSDHFAIIPREHLSSFFFDRLKVYRQNKTHVFNSHEEIYWHTITHEIRDIGKYYIKRS
jgi:hypothetical protein